MAEDTTGTTTYDVNLVSGDGGERYIDGMTVTGPDGTSTDYAFRPENYDAVEAARAAAWEAGELANAAARNADSATASATSAASSAAAAATKANGAASAANGAAAAASQSKAECDEAVANAKNMLPLGLYLDDDGDICQKE